MLLGSHRGTLWKFWKCWEVQRGSRSRRFRARTKPMKIHILDGTVGQTGTVLGRTRTCPWDKGRFLLNCTVKSPFCPICPWDEWGLSLDDSRAKGIRKMFICVLCLLGFFRSPGLRNPGFGDPLNKHPIPPPKVQISPIPIQGRGCPWRGFLGAWGVGVGGSSRKPADFRFPKFNPGFRNLRIGVFLEGWGVTAEGGGIPHHRERYNVCPQCYLTPGP